MSSVSLAAQGIHAIDTGFHRPHFDAAYLIVQDGRAAFVDCGTNHSVPHLLDALRTVDLDVGDVDWLILTHVHLDHAGGAGLLMQQLPNATAVAHPRAAPHLIDPARLIAGATAVYGEAEMQRSYGRIEAVAATRLRVVESGERVALAGRELEFLDTPGHARHHHCIWDGASRSWFTGDTFGISYRELDTADGPFLFPTTTPVQFEPAPLHRSIDALAVYEPLVMNLTHYASIAFEPRLPDALHAQIDAMVALAQSAPAGDGRHRWLVDALEADLRTRLRAHGCALGEAALRGVVAMDLELNAQGLGVWLDRQHGA